MNIKLKHFGQTKPKQKAHYNFAKSLYNLKILNSKVITLLFLLDNNNIIGCQLVELKKK